MRFAYNVDTMDLLHVHRVQDILHGLVQLESPHVKRVMFEFTDNPRLLDNLTTWELPKLFRNVTGQDPDPAWTAPVVRELLALRIGEMKPRLVDDGELERQIEAVELELRKLDCPPYLYCLGGKLPRLQAAPAAPLCMAKGFTAAQVAQAAGSAVARAAALSAANVPVSRFAANAPWAKNNACAPGGGDATVRNDDTEVHIKQEIDMATPEELAAAKAAKEQEAAAKKAAAATAKATKDQAKIDAKAAKDAKAAADKAAKEKAKADAEAAKVATKLPEQNGITRPKPDTLCGKAWGTFDAISTKNGAPASIAEAKEHPALAGMAEATVRTQYARWRKFYGVTGRVDAPKPVEPATTTTPTPETAPAQ